MTTLVTSMSKRRFMELINGMMDGSLRHKYDTLPKPYSKADKVEERQLIAIYAMWKEHNEQFKAWIDTPFREFRIIRNSRGEVTAQIVH